MVGAEALSGERDRELYRNLAGWHIGIGQSNQGTTRGLVT